MRVVLEEINLSIGIVTRNRFDSLKRTLESLSKQTVSPYEVLISDDSDSIETILSNQLLCETYGYIYLQGPKRGLYSNRNFVSLHCTGTHIRTMDDDHEFPPNHIEECVAAIKLDHSAIWTIGEYLPTDVSKSIPAPIPGQMNPRGFSYSPINMDNYYGISCGATIYPRIVVEKRILNSEAYPFGILYLEYGSRLINRGYRIRHLSKTYVIHHFDKDSRSVSSLKIINGARIYSMLMFSFRNRKTFRNKTLTLLQLGMEVMLGKYTPSVLINAYKKFLKEKLL